MDKYKLMNQESSDQQNDALNNECVAKQMDYTSYF